MLDMALQNRALRGELKHSYALISQEWAGAGRFLCHAEVKSPLENVILKLRIGWLKQISSFWQKLPGKKVKEYITLGNAPLCEDMMIDMMIYHSGASCTPRAKSDIAKYWIFILNLKHFSIFLHILFTFLSYLYK